MTTLKRSKVRDQAIQEIKNFIASEKLNPGDRLPTENQLARDLGISRLSVREATKALEFLGIVESKTGVGLTVGQMDLGRFTEHLEFHPSVLHADAREWINSRVILETGVIPYVIRNMRENPDIERNLRELVQQFKKARSVKAWIDLDLRFHRTLLEASHLAPLVAFGDLLQAFFKRFRASVRKAEWKASIESHEEIVESLSKGNEQLAVSLLQEHIESHLQRA